MINAHEDNPGVHLAGEPQAAGKVYEATVRSDQPISTFNVRVGEPTGERWFRVLRGLVQSGFWAQLDHRHQSTLIVMCELRDDETGVAFAPIHACTAPDGTDHQGLLALTGLKEPTIRQALREMTAARPAPGDASENDRGIAAAGLLARLGRDTYSVLPGRRFAGRKRDHEPPPDAVASPSRCHHIISDATASKTVPALRIPALKTNQPTVREIGQDQNQVRATGSLVGWSGFGLFWNLDTCTDVRQALLRLEVFGWLLDATVRLEGLTVAEIDSVARGVKSDTTVRNPSFILASRLFDRRGLLAPKSGSNKQLSGEWDALARIRFSRTSRSSP